MLRSIVLILSLPLLAHADAVPPFEEPPDVHHPDAWMKENVGKTFALTAKLTSYDFEVRISQIEKTGVLVQCNEETTLLKGQTQILRRVCKQTPKEVPAIRYRVEMHARLEPTTRPQNNLFFFSQGEIQKITRLKGDGMEGEVLYRKPAREPILKGIGQ